MPKFRSVVVLLCGVVAVAGLLFGGILTYTARSLFDPDTFAARVADGLARPQVAKIVAERVTDQIVEMRRDLLAYRPIIVGSVERVVASPPFRAVLRRTVREAHARIVSAAGENLSLTLADAGVIVREALSMYPDIAAKVPAGASVMLSNERSWPHGKNLARALQFAHRIRTRALAVTAVGLLAGVTGLVLARRKHQYLIRCGFGLTVAAFVFGLAARFGSEIAASLSGSPIAAEIVRGVWPTFVQPLARRMLIVAAMGLVVVAAVTSSFARVIHLDTVRGVWRYTSTRPTHPALAVLRGAGLLLAGALAGLYPRLALEILVVMLGAALFFVGVQELFAMILRSHLQEQGVAVAGRPRRPGAARIVLAVALPLALIGAGVALLQRDDELAAAPAISDACCGHPELCDRRLNEVAFAATHNAMAAADVPAWMFPNQEKGIAAQLEAGVRGFMIDVHYGVPVGDRVKTILEDETVNLATYEELLGKEGVEAAMRIRARLVGKETGEREVYLGHGFCELGAMRFVTALETMNEFLVRNPGEILLLLIQDEGVAPADIAACFEESGLIKFVYRGPVKPPWPTLRELIASDGRVLVFAEHEVGDIPWYHKVFDVFQETPYRFADPSQFSNQPNRGGDTGSLLLMNHWIETTPAPKPSNAEIVNAYDLLYQRAQACQRTRGMIPTLVAVDFYATGDLMRVVDALNGVGAPPMESQTRPQ